MQIPFYTQLLFLIYIFYYFFFQDSRRVTKVGKTTLKKKKTKSFLESVLIVHDSLHMLCVENTWATVNACLLTTTFKSHRN